jgi:hypothetical protein
MPNLNEFLNKEIKQKDYELENLPGVRACNTCDEDRISNVLGML